MSCPPRSLAGFSSEDVRTEEMHSSSILKYDAIFVLVLHRGIPNSSDCDKMAQDNPDRNCTLHSDNDTRLANDIETLSLSGSDAPATNSSVFMARGETSHPAAPIPFLRPVRRAVTRSRSRADDSTASRLAGFRGLEQLMSTTINPRSPKSFTEIALSSGHQHTVLVLFGPDIKTHDFSEHLLRFPASDGRTLRETYPHSKWIVCMVEMAFKFVLNARTDEDELRVHGPLFSDQVSLVRDLLWRESMDVDDDYSKLTLVGIGHGCAIAASVLLTQSQRLGRFIGMSGWMPSEPELIDMGLKIHRGENLRTQVMVTHSRRDGKISVKEGRRVMSALTVVGMSVLYKEYWDGGHGVHRKFGVDDVIWFVRNVAGTDGEEAYYAWVDRVGGLEYPPRRQDAPL